ncbi:hypothetical protein RhiirA4_422744 [Rhizophagus irregularis]|uniref:Uncharacterized protein n=1 Tax=Rhizophagus irregularis TaxID=588596 RepID=A0A2I1GRA0_9GLOM|nr:hypothetical protein RhiirA4_422744 [Rhizophagus irregularis]
MKRLKRNRRPRVASWTLMQYKARADKFNLYPKALLEESFPKSLVTKYYVTRELGNALFSFLEYFPRIETIKKIEKLNKLYDDIVESKRKSMETGELKKKLNNNTADLLDHIVTIRKINEMGKKKFAMRYYMFLAMIYTKHGTTKEIKIYEHGMNENLRLYLPVSHLPRRVTSQDIKFHDHIIPAKIFSIKKKKNAYYVN